MCIRSSSWVVNVLPQNLQLNLATFWVSNGGGDGGEGGEGGLSGGGGIIMGSCGVAAVSWGFGFLSYGKSGSLKFCTVKGQVAVVF